MHDTATTTLDLAVAKMQSDADARFGFYERVLESEMFMILEDEVVKDVARPLVLDTSDCAVALIFDTEERLAEFAGEPVPYLALSGRKIVAMLAQNGIGLGVNLGCVSETVLPVEIVNWLAENLGSKDSIEQEKPVEISAPFNVPEALIKALDQKLANMSGVVSVAYLVAVEYETGSKSHMLALVDVTPDAQNGVAEAMSEALLFSGIEAGHLDITFLLAGDASVSRFVKVGLAFEIPELILPKMPEITAPGMDPDKPPKLR
ncbi:MAG: enhanced serine sensitivity protein SseB C-terminal domain-containing protein [Rhodobacteraceae bacterium]|nr:enhanced serine sensitivity protein SseB C-terminal domain-containing protein [Paracoccaceae bacterium]